MVKKNLDELTKHFTERSMDDIKRIQSKIEQAPAGAYTTTGNRDGIVVHQGNGFDTPRDLHKTFPDETELVKHILLELGRLFPEMLRAWRNNRGNFKTQGGGFIKCGIDGQADISGIVAGGRRLEIECKQPGQKQNADQIAFMHMIRRFNGIYIVAYCLADVIQGLAWT